MESLPMAASLPLHVLRHAEAIDRDVAIGSALPRCCSFCGEGHEPCARNLATARESDLRLAPERVRVGLMSERDLMQTEWSGMHAARYLRDLQKAPDAPVTLFAEQERRVRDGEAADAELTRRGVGERYC